MFKNDARKCFKVTSELLSPGDSQLLIGHSGCEKSSVPLELTALRFCLKLRIDDTMARSLKLQHGDNEKMSLKTFCNQNSYATIRRLEVDGEKNLNNQYITFESCVAIMSSYVNYGKKIN